MKKMLILLTSMAMAGTYAQAAGTLATSTTGNNNTTANTSNNTGGSATVSGAATTGTTTSSNTTTNRNRNRNRNRNNTGNTSTTTTASAQGNQNNRGNNNSTNFDRTFIRRAIADNEYEIELGSQAQTNSSNAAVQALGAQLVADHTAALQQAQEVAAILGMNVGTNNMSGANRQGLNRMGNMNGTQFDNAFLRASLQSHLRDIQLYETAAARGTAPEVRDYARAQLPILVDHYVATLDVRDQVQGTATTSGAATTNTGTGNTTTSNNSNTTTTTTTTTSTGG